MAHNSRILELLAPAKNKEIGIAAINCGADAVYIAAGRFGARRDAGNSLEDLAELCAYAHRFGARVFITVNTIIYDSEVSELCALVQGLERIGADALIVQDMGLVELIASGALSVGLPLHASTQCAVRTPQKAKWLASLGFSRIVVERQLSLDEIRAIAAAVPEVEIEAFVHGAICTGYSGQCYLSEALCGRSANRGECSQACRSRYDLVDGSGRVLAHDKLLLSLKDYCLIDYLPQMAEAGVMSFKIEGRLKGASYVKNVVGQYSAALNCLEGYRRASYGVGSGCAFGSAGAQARVDRDRLNKTFNRGYTTLYINGVKDGSWMAGDVENGVGEFIGEVVKVGGSGSCARSGAGVGSGIVDVRSRIILHNADGFAVAVGDKFCGFRASKAVPNGVGQWKLTVETLPAGIRPGAKVYRNLDFEFEKALEKEGAERYVSLLATAAFDGSKMKVRAEREDGTVQCFTFDFTDKPVANNPDRVLSLVSTAFSKKAGDYQFLSAVSSHSLSLPLVSASELNDIRRQIAVAFSEIPFENQLVHRTVVGLNGSSAAYGTGLSTGAGSMDDVDSMAAADAYKLNISNDHAAKFYGREKEAYELCHQGGAELMRTRHCIRREMGQCLRQGGKPGPLYLINHGRRITLEFDCKACEMILR